MEQNGYAIKYIKDDQPKTKLDDISAEKAQSNVIEKNSLETKKDLKS